jgi:hypothetical protein
MILQIATIHALGHWRDRFDIVSGSAKWYRMKAANRIIACQTSIPHTSAHPCGSGHGRCKVIKSSTHPDSYQ